MASAADQRLLDLLEKWLKSLELHATYASLDAGSYAKIQAWPEHQRPSRWIIDLATQKAAGLRDQLNQRIKFGDAAFSDSLELMAFLTSLLGSEHIERFIPLAESSEDQSGAIARPSEEPPPAKGDMASTGTREMPVLNAGRVRAPPPTATARVARTERKETAHKPASRAAKPPPDDPEIVRGNFSKPVVDQVIADATRLVQWGRKWYELSELIASMADRPALTDVRRILKDNKTVIDKKAGRG